MLMSLEKLFTEWSFRGRYTVLGLASRGARVWMGARNETKALTAINEIKAQLPSANIQLLKIDLSSLTSVVSAAKELRARETVLHGLVNNAGDMGVPFALTADGYDVQLQVRSNFDRVLQQSATKMGD